MNFFASTCTPCITEMPAFEEVHQELAGEPLAFLGLAVTDRADDALALVEQTGVTYPTAQDPDASVIDRAGRQRPAHHGAPRRGRRDPRHQHGELDADELRSMIADELGISA